MFGNYRPGSVWHKPSRPGFKNGVCMSGCNKSLAMVFLLPLVSLLQPGAAKASSRAYPLQIKVLSAEYHSVGSSTPVPKDCDMQNYSAYCNESRNPTVENVMVVQDSEGNSFTISCTVDSRWSKCSPLPVGETFDAREDKHGITVLYRNAKGKETKQVYQVLAATQTPPSVAARPTSAPPPLPSHPQNSGVAAPAPSATPVTPIPKTSPASGSNVRCSFASTPPGAEISVDGKFVGSTPSEIEVGAGTHAIVFFMPGYAEWKRDLTVIPGSELTVSAILQKQP